MFLTSPLIEQAIYTSYVPREKGDAQNRLAGPCPSF
jgi:hypothetical protein